MKNSFIVYTDNTEYMDLLTDEQLGQLYRAQVEYAKGNDPEIPDATVKVLFAMIKGQMDRDEAKYQQKVDRIKAVNDKKNNDIVTDNNEVDTKSLRSRDDVDSVTDTVTVTDTDKDIGIVNNSLSDCASGIQALVTEWNKLEELGIKPVSKIAEGSKRHQSIKARIRQYGIGAVLKAIQNIRDSDFLQGKNKQGWQITFDWFLLPNNFPKVLEGNYQNKEPCSKSDDWVKEWVAKDG